MRISPVLVALSLLIAFSSLLIGSSSLSIADVLSGLMNSDPVLTTVVYEIRLPRILAAFLVGATLGLSGAALQGLLRNPLAEPGVLGVSASATLFATTTLFFGFSALSSFVLPLFAVIGAMTATLLLTYAAAKIESVVTLILIGVGISSFAGALMALLMNMAPHPFSLSDMVNWSMGSVANRSLDDLFFAAPFIITGAVLILISARDLSAFSLGEEAAAGIGADLSSIRSRIVLGTGLCVGGAVAIAGAVGFIGIVAPHLIRPFVKYEPSATLVPSALLGGFMLLVADLFIRIAPTTTELKLGVVAALIGAPVFVWIASQRMMSGGQDE